MTINEFTILDGVLRNIDYKNLTEDDFSFVWKVEYDREKIEAALPKGKHAIVISIRTNNMYPIGTHGEAIADSITNLFKSKSSQSIELVFDDQELLRL